MCELILPEGTSMSPEFIPDLAQQIDRLYRREVVDVRGGELVEDGFVFLDKQRVLVEFKYSSKRDEDGAQNQLYNSPMLSPAATAIPVRLL